MKSIKESMKKVAESAAYIIMAAPLLIGMELPFYQGYKSGFVKNYNQAIVRNADINHDGLITPTEELKFRQKLHSEITELRIKGQDLEKIVDYLKTR